MKFEFPQITRFSILLLFVNFSNAERSRFAKVQAGIDRPCPENSEYRPSQDETTTTNFHSGNILPTPATKSYWVYSAKVIFVFGREILNLSHPTLSPVPNTVDINDVEVIGKRDEKCTTIPGRILPAIKRIRKGHQSTSLGMTNSDNFYESNESESDVVEYFIYGTLLVTCLIILLLW